MGDFWHDLKGAAQEFLEDKAPRLAAALAYYTIFSLAPLLVIVIAVIGLAYGSEEARQQLVGQLEPRVGEQAAGLIQTMIERTGDNGGGVLATVIGTAALLIGATTVFAQLQKALNEIWDVAEQSSGGFMAILLTRLQGLAMVIVLGLLLLSSFVLQAGLNIIMTNLAGTLPGGEWLWYLLNLVLTLALLAVVFAEIFRVLPDVELSWRDVWRGALLTAVLFKLGEVLIGIYLSTSGVGSTYGAAGSLVVLLLWIYYSAQILLFGAEYTQVETRRRKQDAPAATAA